VCDVKQALRSRGVSQLLEQFIECAAGILGIAGRRRSGDRAGGGCGRRRGKTVGGALPCDCHPRRKQRAIVPLVLDRDPYRDWLEALKSRGRFEMRALLATVQIGITFRTHAVHVGAGRQGGCAIKAAGRCHMLHQPGKARSGYVNGRTRTLRLGPVFTRPARLAVRIHVPMLSVLTVIVHAG
jgi:hypothetical protein